MQVPVGWAVLSDGPVAELYGQQYPADTFVAPVPDEGFNAKVSILSLPSQGRTTDQLADWVSALKEAFAESEFESQSKIVVQKLERSELNGRDVVVLNYTAPAAERNLDFAQVFFVQGEREWVLSLATAAGYRDKYLPTFQRMCETFELKE